MKIPHLNPRVRLAGALCIFLCCLSVSLWLVAKRWSQMQTQQGNPAAPQTLAQTPAIAPQSESVFYQTIGQDSAKQDAVRPTLAAAAELQPGPPQASYTLEIKQVMSREEAEQAVATLRTSGRTSGQASERSSEGTSEASGSGVDAYYTPLNRHGRIIYRVRRGIYSDERAAQKAQVALREEYKIPSKIVRLQ